MSSYNPHNNKYLTNESECIDRQFSFSNEIHPSKDNIIKTNNMLCEGNIMLEPRLQEYIKKKKFYKQNNIHSPISPEKEFNITNKDRKILKDFLGGRKNMYLKGNKYIEPKNDITKKSFPSKTYRDGDSRVLKPNNFKYNNDVPNRGMFYSDNPNEYYKQDMIPLDVNMDSRDFGVFTNYEKNGFTNEDTNGLFMTDSKNDDGYGWNLNESKFNPRIDPKIDPGVEEHNKLKSQYRIGPNNNNNNNYVDNIKYSEKSDVDYESKKFIPNVSSNVRKDLNTSSYDRMPVFNKDYMNTELETSLVRGMPSNNKSKSYGYRNSDEHYYDYINDDFQHPDNVVMPFPRGGEGTRQYDKGMAKNNYIYNNRENY